MQKAVLIIVLQNETFTLAIQKEYQANSTFQLSPGEEFPDEASPSSTTTSGGVPASTSTDSSASGSESTRTSLSGGAIAGIAIGGTAVVIIIVALVYICGRKGGIEKGYRRSKVPSTLPPAQMVEVGYSDNTPKSPPMGSPYAMSSYRSPSPGTWSSQMGSPHTSYMGQHPSPGFPPYGIGSPFLPGQEQQTYV